VLLWCVRADVCICGEEAQIYVCVVRAVVCMCGEEATLFSRNLIQ